MNWGCLDLGCLDLGCVNLEEENQKPNSCSESWSSDSNDSLSSATKHRKDKSPKDKDSPPLALNRVASQIKKPLHRKTSPLNWFPRQKGDSYMKRKIKLLQEAGGMNDTLDETLGHSNPHYCRVEREKRAASAAACKVIEARKAAMIEASWCRILQAARIPHKEAEAVLLKVDKEVEEAFEAATAKGVTMYDTPDRPLKRFSIEISSASGKGSTTHTVRASFESAFEVDKQVAAAVKTAFVRLAHCSSFNKDEFKDLLRKISENPETQELSESENVLEFETEITRDDGSNSQRKSRKKKQSPQKFSGTKLVEMMLERLKCLKEEELASLAIIVATCGLNAALADTENHRVQDKNYLSKTNTKEKQAEPELPSLDKFLVKKMTKLEKEVQEAKNARIAESKKDDARISVDSVPSLESVLVKHSSKLEKEVEEAKRTRKLSDADGPKSGKCRQLKHGDSEVPTLDQCLVKHMSKLEKEVQEAKKENINNLNTGRCKNQQGKQNEGQSESLDKVLVKHVSKLEKEKMRAASKKVMVEIKKRGTEPNKDTGAGGLDQILVKHKSRLEREKTALSEQGEDRYSYSKVKRRDTEPTTDAGAGGLDQILVKHMSRLETEKAALSEQGEDRYSYSKVKRRDTEPTTDASAGGLDRILVKHKSRLETEKAALSEQGEDRYSYSTVKRKNTEPNTDTSAGGLDQILVKNKSRLEREKTNVFEQSEDRYSYSTKSRREARDKELLDTWGGIGLGNSMRPHLSRLQRDKAAWIKAEEEEKQTALQENQV